ncbi:MAG: hypothetical protein WDO17_00950 [Alphaproteobacteria bacterium]
MQAQLWKFFNAPLGLLLVGFVLTSIIGAVLSAWLQQRNWKRQTQLSLFQKRYDEGVKFLDDLSDLIGKRYFALQKLIWALRDRRSYDLEKVTAEYHECVQEWNGKLRTMRGKARLLVGEDRALDFLDYNDDRDPDKPHSLHYVFVKAGRTAIAAKSDPEQMDKAEQQVAQLNWLCSNLLDDMTSDFLKRAARLEILDIPIARRVATSRPAETESAG